MMFIMKNFNDQNLGLILRGRTSVIKLKNFNGNASIILLILKVDFEKWTFQMENVMFVKNWVVRKISNTCFINAVKRTALYQA